MSLGCIYLSSVLSGASLETSNENLITFSVLLFLLLYSSSTSCTTQQSL